jgi:hypothetical protein
MTNSIEKNQIGETERRGSYDTAINIIGGLKDCSVIYQAFSAYFDQNDSLNQMLNGRNEFNLRTQKSRTRIESAVVQNFLEFVSPEHVALLKSFFLTQAALTDREMVLFWQMAFNNRLFREISQNVFMKIYFSGRVGINKDDIIAWLKEFLSQNKSLNLKWSEKTIETLATKYLNLMTKLNLLEGSRSKLFKHIRATAESLIIFLYFARLHQPFENNLLENQFLSLCFVSKEDLIDRLKKLSLKGYFNMTFNGTALNIELVHSYKGICDALYNRP